MVFCWWGGGQFFEIQNFSSLHLSRLYYQYIPEGKEYPVLCRRLDTQKSGWMKTFLHYARGGFGREETFLDWNEIAEQYGKLLSYLLTWEEHQWFLSHRYYLLLANIFLLYWHSMLQVMCTWVLVEFHPTTIFLHTHLILLAVNDSCFKLRTLEVDALFQNHELMGLLAWHGLKMEILCFIQYQMIINDLTGKVTVLDPFSWGVMTVSYPFFSLFGQGSLYQTRTSWYGWRPGIYRKWF